MAVEGGAVSLYQVVDNFFTPIRFSIATRSFIQIPRNCLLIITARLLRLAGSTVMFDYRIRSASIQLHSSIVRFSLLTCPLVSVSFLGCVINFVVIFSTVFCSTLLVWLILIRLLPGGH